MVKNVKQRVTNAELVVVVPVNVAASSNSDRTWDLQFFRLKPRSVAAAEKLRFVEEEGRFAGYCPRITDRAARFTFFTFDLCDGVAHLTPCLGSF